MPQDVFATAVEAKPPEVACDEQLRRLEAQIHAGRVGVQDKLIAQVRALMVDPGPDRERAGPVGEWEADDEVGVDQVVRAGLHIELGEHARRHAHLPLVGMPTRQHDILAESDARNLPGDDRRRDPQPRGEEMRLFRIGDQRGECARAVLRVEGWREQNGAGKEKRGGAAAFHVPKLTSAPFPLRTHYSAHSGG